MVNGGIAIELFVPFIEQNSEKLHKLNLHLFSFGKNQNKKFQIEQNIYLNLVVPQIRSLNRSKFAVYNAEIARNATAARYTVL